MEDVARHGFDAGRDGITTICSRLLLEGESNLDSVNVNAPPTNDDMDAKGGPDPRVATGSSEHGSLEHRRWTLQNSNITDGCLLTLRC